MRPTNPYWVKILHFIISHIWSIGITIANSIGIITIACPIGKFTRAGVQDDQHPGGWAKPRLVYVSGSQAFGLLHINHSENFLQMCKIHNKSSCTRALNRLFSLALQYILRWLISLWMNYRRQNEIFGIGIWKISSHWVSVFRDLIPWLQRSFGKKTSGQTRKMKKRILGSIH